MQNVISRAALGRLPMYLRFLNRLDAENVSAAQIARHLGLGEVQVRKDLASVCPAGLPRVGYPVRVLRADLERTLGISSPVLAVIVGAGRLGSALMEYDGFGEYGLAVAAAFDAHADGRPRLQDSVPVYPMDLLGPFCAGHGIHTGILTVPADSAQAAADRMAASGITAILNFAPCHIKTPSHVTVRQENIALSLAYLNITAGGLQQAEEEQYGKQIG